MSTPPVTNGLSKGKKKTKLVKVPRGNRAQSHSKLHCLDCGTPVAVYDLSGLKCVGNACAYECLKCKGKIRMISRNTIDSLLKTGCGVKTCKVKHKVVQAPDRVKQDVSFHEIRKKALPPTPSPKAQTPVVSGTSTPTPVAVRPKKIVPKARVSPALSGQVTPKAKDGKKRRTAPLVLKDDEDLNDPLTKELLTLVKRFRLKTRMDGYVPDGPVPGDGDIEINWLYPRFNDDGVPINGSYFIWPLLNIHVGLNVFSWGFVYTDYTTKRTVMDINGVQKTIVAICAQGKLEVAAGKYLTKLITMTDTFGIFQVQSAGVANYTWCKIDEETQDNYLMTASVRNKKFSRSILDTQGGFYSLLDSGGTFSDLTSYMSGKSIDASSVRVAASIASRNVTDPKASAMLTAKVSKDNTVFVSSNKHKLSDGRSWSRPWTLFGWFYTKIRAHNKNVSDPFVDAINWAPILAALLFVATILYHYYNKRRMDKKFLEYKSFGFSAPGWLARLFMLGILKSRLSFTKTSWADFKNLFFKNGPVDPIVVDTECFEYAPVKECDADARWSIDYSRFRCKPTFGNQLIGVAVVENIPMMPRTCTHNEHRAVTQRQLRPTVRPKEGFWDERKVEVEQLFRQLDREWVYVTVDRVNLIVNLRGSWQTIDFKLWYRNLSPNARKGVDDVIKHFRPLRKKDLSIKAFVKRENTPICGDKRALATFDPRLISGRSAKYQMETGPATYTITKLVASLWHPNNNITYSSGLTAEKVGAWYSEALSDFSRPIIIENDASRFDSSVSVPALKYEFHVYRRLGMPQSFIRTLRYQYKTWGYTPGGVSFSVPGTRKSGDGNTSVGNTILNAAIMFYCFKQLGCKHFRILINGDDSISVIDEIDYDKVVKVIKEIWLQAGFEVKVLVYSDPWLAQFCSGRFYPVEGGYRFAPKIGRLVSKLGFSKDKITRTYDTLVRLKGIGLGLQNTVSFLPIAGGYVANMVNIQVEAQPIKEKYKILSDTEAKADETTWAMVSHVYGVAVDELVKLDDWFRKTVFPSMIKSEILTRMCDVDASEKRVPGAFSAFGLGVRCLVSKVCGFWLGVHEEIVESVSWAFGKGFPSLQWMINYGSELQCYFIAPVVEELTRSCYPITTTTLLIVFETLMFAQLLYEPGMDLKSYDRQVRGFFITRLLGHGALYLINQFDVRLAIVCHMLLNWSVA